MSIESPILYLDEPTAFAPHDSLETFRNLPLKAQRAIKGAVRIGRIDNIDDIRNMPDEELMIYVRGRSTRSGIGEGTLRIIRQLYPPTTEAPLLQMELDL